MNGFKFRLATLKKLREAVRDQRRAELAEALRAESILEEQMEAVDGAIKSMLEECRAASGPGPVDVDRLTQAHLHQLLLERQKRILEDYRQRLTEEVQHRREALAQADREVRILERLEAKQLERYRCRQLQQEVRHLDEVALRQVNNRSQQADPEPSPTSAQES
ncbi:MAG: hypothetical protein NZ602_08205 [Thermoguttaceae bacterium]|nr:hypothetical protein [Thermoguttaceae bacterium]MDW8037263.1 hypothetical protein [Thermoguttaceae bacterium]